MGDSLRRARPLGRSGHLGYHAAVMRSRRIVLAVMLYLGLDVATPTLPGAGQLVGADLEIVNCCRVRGSRVAMPVDGAALPRRPVVSAAPRDVRARANPPGAPRPTPLLVRASLPRSR